MKGRVDVGSPRVSGLIQGELWQVVLPQGGPALREGDQAAGPLDDPQRLWVAESGVGCNLSGQTAPWG